MSPEAIERVLADFRVWLTDLAAVPPPSDEPDAIDLHALVAQFTALRHEVNLQTKSTRTSVEQSGDALKQLEEALTELRERPAAETDDAGPLLKAIVDVYDNLALALRQVERQRTAIDEPLAQLVEGTKIPDMPKVDPEPVAIRPGFWWRLFGVSAGQSLGVANVGTFLKEAETRGQQIAEAAKLARSSFDGLIAGYRMSLARLERAIEKAGLEPIEAVGEAFDPELMEVVEIVADSGRPAGEVLEVVRRGYFREQVVFRYAQVKVAR